MQLFLCLFLCILVLEVSLRDYAFVWVEWDWDEVLKFSGKLLCLGMEEATNLGYTVSKTKGLNLWTRAIFRPWCCGMNGVWASPQSTPMARLIGAKLLIREYFNTVFNMAHLSFGKHSTYSHFTSKKKKKVGQLQSSLSEFFIWPWTHNRHSYC